MNWNCAVVNFSEHMSDMPFAVFFPCPLLPKDPKKVAAKMIKKKSRCVISLLFLKIFQPFPSNSGYPNVLVSTQNYFSFHCVARLFLFSKSSTGCTRRREDVINYCLTACRVDNPITSRPMRRNAYDDV